MGYPPRDRAAAPLDRARALLRARPRLDASETRLLLASATGFSTDLVAVADDRTDVVLVDLDRIYTGE